MGFLQVQAHRVDGPAELLGEPLVRPLGLLSRDEAVVVHVGAVEGLGDLRLAHLRLLAGRRRHRLLGFQWEVVTGFNKLRKTLFAMQCTCNGWDQSHQTLYEI